MRREASGLAPQSCAHPAGAPAEDPRDAELPLRRARTPVEAVEAEVVRPVGTVGGPLRAAVASAARGAVAIGHPGHTGRDALGPVAVTARDVSKLAYAFVI